MLSYGLHSSLIDNVLFPACVLTKELKILWDSQNLLFEIVEWERMREREEGRGNKQRERETGVTYSKEWDLGALLWRRGEGGGKNDVLGVWMYGGRNDDGEESWDLSRALELSFVVSGMEFGSEISSFAGVEMMDLWVKLGVRRWKIMPFFFIRSYVYWPMKA